MVTYVFIVQFFKVTKFIEECSFSHTFLVHMETSQDSFCHLQVILPVNTNTMYEWM